MLDHPVTEHLPKDVATELRQCGIDEEVLLFQGFGERAARAGITFFHPRILHETGNDFQGSHGFIQSGFRLFDLFGYCPYCPDACVFPKSIQYRGVSYDLYSDTGTAFRMFHRLRRDLMLSVQVIVMLARLSRLVSFSITG